MRSIEAAKHGHARRGKRSPEYRIWIAMRERCECESHIGFKYYGGRSISVCERWLNDFSAFLADMGEKPSPKHTIDRRDTNGNYEPSNCQWATYAEQRANQRPYDERGRVLKAWSTRSRISKNRKNLLGQKFVRLTVISAAGVKDGRMLWTCRCDCGVEKIAPGKDLGNGRIKSCGCLNRELTSQRAIKRNKLHASDYANARWGRQS